MPDKQQTADIAAAPAAVLPDQAVREGPRSWSARLRLALRGPLLVGIVAALIAIILSLYGMLTNPDATPLTLRSFLLVVLIAGGSWGLIAWAIATAAVEAGKD